MEDYKKELDDYFARFTFGQFVTLLLIQMVALFFVFYLGAHYGPDLIGSRANVASQDKGPLGDKDRSLDEIVGKDKVDYTYPEVLTSPNGKAVKIKPSGMTASEYEKKVQEVPVEVPTQPEPTAESVSGEATGANEAPSDLPKIAKREPEKIEAVAEKSKVVAVAPEAKPEPIAEAKAVEIKPIEEKAVVEEKIEKPIEKAEKVENTKTRFSVQVGSYPSADEAQVVVDKWKKKGYSAYSQEGEIPDKGKWYRVRIGGFDTRPEAQVFLEKLQKREKVNALVVSSKS